MIGGVYSVVLGAVNPLNVAFDQIYYLGLTLPGGPEHTPRAKLTSAPYALSLLGQDNKFPSTGNVGIGTTAPTTGLDANSSISTATVTTSAAAYTVLAADHVIFLDLAGAQAVTLPSAVTFLRREIVLINKTSTAKTVSTYVDLAGATATAIPANGMIELRSNGTEWRLATTFAPTATAAKAYVYCRGSGTSTLSGFTTMGWTEITDTQNAFSSTTFTAPRTGIYRVSGTVGFNSTPSGSTYLVVDCGGTCPMGIAGQHIGASHLTAGFNSAWGINFGADVQMTAGQTLFLRLYQNAGTHTIQSGADTGLTITEL
jgi:hypothetical protein